MNDKSHALAAELYQEMLRIDPDDPHLPDYLKIFYFLKKSLLSR